MPAWTQRGRLTTATRNNHLAQNAPSGFGGDSALQSYIGMRMKRYIMDDQKCFFCGARGHHTGHLPGYGGIWLCKNRCEDKYSEVVRDL